MVLSVSMGLLLLVFVAILLRGRHLRASHAVVCVLLGFYLAGTSVAPTIQQGMDSTAELVGSFKP